MIHLTEETEILIAIDPIDFRKQIDGIAALCSNQFSQDTYSGKLFVFINRGKTMIRFLHHDGSGYWLATKRLSRGRYDEWPKKDSKSIASIHAKEFKKILNSLIATRVKRV